MPASLRPSWLGGLLACLLPTLTPAQPPSPAAGSAPPVWQFQETHRFPAPEARQGVAADATHFYAIDNQAIGKYRLDTGARVSSWQGEKDGPLTHLNAGILRDGKLYCAHSNYPAQPTVSSVEIWDTATMQHIGSHSFGHWIGSLTWIDHHNGHWYACFAHYAGEKSSARDAKPPSYTEVVKLDDRWHRVAGWIFPPALITRFAGHSSSGGGFGPGGRLYVTGHDARELYEITFPTMGSVLHWTGTTPTTFPGQAFHWQAPAQGLLYAIDRARREVVAGRLVKTP